MGKIILHQLLLCIFNMFYIYYYISICTNINAVGICLSKSASQGKLILKDSIIFIILFLFNLLAYSYN